MIRTYCNIWNKASRSWAPAKKLTLCADGLFRFGGFGCGDLTHGGRLQIGALLAEIRRSPKSWLHIVVTGRSDDAGTDALLLARVGTIRNLLGNEGIATNVLPDAGPSDGESAVTPAGSRKVSELPNGLRPDLCVELEVA